MANTTLFSTTHAHEGATFSNKGTAALAITALKDAINAMLKFPGDKDKPLNNMPVFLVVPPALAIEAARILSSEFLIVSGGDSTTGSLPVAQPSRTGIEGLLRVVVDPYIPVIDTTNGHTSWYLFSDPRRIHAAEYAFLRGYEQPQVFKRAPNAMRLGGGQVERTSTRTASATRCGTCSAAATPMQPAAGVRLTGATARGRKAGLSDIAMFLPG